MNLTLFFRLILTSIFQSMVTSGKESYRDTPMSYDNQSFFCPRIICKDGWNISLQIHYGNYCESENGYRKFGHTMQKVEFGFPSFDDKDLHPFCESYGYAYDDEYNEIEFNPDTFTSTGSVGSISIEDIERIINNNHGGIDWEATISIAEFDKLTKMQ